MKMITASDALMGVHACESMAEEYLRKAIEYRRNGDEISRREMLRQAEEYQRTADRFRVVYSSAPIDLAH